MRGEERGQRRKERGEKRGGESRRGHGRGRRGEGGLEKEKPSCPYQKRAIKAIMIKM